MKMRIFSLATLVFGIFLAAAEGFCAEDKEPTPLTLVEQCRAMVPQNVSISGRIVLRNRRGIVQAEYSYALERKEGETTLVVKDSGGNEVPFKKEGRLLGTDVTWSDLTLDYLWWDDFGYDAERESETLHT